MANDPNFVFSVDASVILAKLHLAGKQQAPNYLVINSAVINDDSGTPENPGNAKFDMKSKDGNYEVCLVKKNVEYIAALDPKSDPEIQKLIEKMTKAKSTAAGAKEKKEEAKDNQKLTDDNAKTDKADSEAKKANEEVDSMRKQYIDRLKAIGLKDLKSESTDEEISTVLKEVNEKRAEERAKSIDQAKKEMFKEMKAYFMTFAGKENASKLDVSKVLVAQMPEKCDSSKDVKIQNYIIATIDDKEKEELKKKHAVDQTKNMIVNLGFKVGYHLDLDA